MYFLFGFVANESKEPDDSRSSHMRSYRARQITMGLLLRVVVRKMVIDLAEAGRVIIWLVFSWCWVGNQQALGESD